MPSFFFMSIYSKFKTSFFSLFFIPFVLIFFHCSQASSAEVTLAWNASSGSDVSGYRIYYGTSSGNYTNNTNVGRYTSCTISSLDTNRTYYFAATAYNSSGQESAFSNQVSKYVPQDSTSTTSTTSGSAATLDNGGSGTSSTGTWVTSGGSNPYGQNSLYSKTAGSTYTFQRSVTGSCRISMWWTQYYTRDQSVPVRIYNGNTLLDTVWVNQQTNGGMWNVLGTYSFTGTARIVIVSESSSYTTCADAVRFEPQN